MNEEGKTWVLNLVKELMEADFKKWEQFSPKHVEKARKCLKHFKCIACLDTSRVLAVRDGYMFGIYYYEYTCAVCNNGATSYIDKHNNYQDAKGYKGRQIPCNDPDKRNEYSHTGNLSTIYDLEFEALDKEIEKREKDAKK